MLRCPYAGSGGTKDWPGPMDGAAISSNGSAAAPTFMTVPVPMGVFPGMTVVVQAPTGQRLAVIVPQGVGPGGVFKVPIPAPPPPQIRYY